MAGSLTGNFGIAGSLRLFARGRANRDMPTTAFAVRPARCLAGWSCSSFSYLPGASLPWRSFSEARFEMFAFGREVPRRIDHFSN